MLGMLLRWYYKNSYNTKYVESLESELDKLRLYMENSVIIEHDNVNQKKEILSFLKKEGKHRGESGLDCNFRINDYILYKITYNETGREYYYSIKNVKSKKEYTFYGRSGYMKCLSNTRYVDMSHHCNNSVYNASLAQVPEFMVGYL